MPSPECDEDELIPSESSTKYRYFNQPIEQIPNHEDEEFQILVHTKTGGLHWLTLNTNCIDVVTCITLEEDGLKAQRKRIITIKDFGNINEEEESSPCETIPVTGCPPTP